MSDFVKTMKHLNKICQKFNGFCEKCPIGKEFKKFGTPYSCRDSITSNPEKTEEIIEKWAKDNLITNKMKFEEVFGLTPSMINDCIFLGGGDCTHHCSSCPHHDFWNKEYKGE